MNQTQKNALAIFLFGAMMGLMIWSYSMLSAEAHKAKKTAWNESMEKSFEEFSGELQKWALSPPQKNGKVDVGVLNSLYEECSTYRLIKKSDSAPYLYPAFQAQLGQILSICTNLAQQEQHGGVTATHLKQAVNTYNEGLVTTLQAVQPQRQAWVSSQMQSLAK